MAFFSADLRRGAVDVGCPFWATPEVGPRRSDPARVSARHAVILRVSDVLFGAEGWAYSGRVTSVAPLLASMLPVR
jgi:hypothetical protein